MFTLYYPMQRILYLLHARILYLQLHIEEGSAWPSFLCQRKEKKGGASMARKRNDGVDRTTVRNQPRTESNIADAEAHNERQKACYRNEDSPDRHAPVR